MQLFAHAVERNPSFIIAKYNLGLSQFENGLIKEAVLEWLSVLDIMPSHQQSQQSLSYTLQYRSGDFCQQLLSTTDIERAMILNRLKERLLIQYPVCEQG